MATMTPREQIEWIQDDVNKLCEERLQLPKLVYLVAPADIVSMTRERSGDVVSCDWFEMSTPAGLVEVRPDVDKPCFLTPTRCYRCPCGELFLDDSSRSGKCVGCMMTSVAQTVRECGGMPNSIVELGSDLYVNTTAGPIRLTADPTLKRDEYRWVDPTEASKWHLDADLRDKLEWVTRDATSGKLTPTTPQEWRAVLDAARVTDPPSRPDGFDQRQVDAAKAVLLTPVKVKR